MLMASVTSTDPYGSFGIALIERGHEVGGGDQRTRVATRMQILQAEEFDDGRWGVVTAGFERLDVLEWMGDDPYPQALVATRPVLDNGGGSIDDLEQLLRATVGAAAEYAGVAAPEGITFSNDPQEKLDQLSALAPISEFDRQQVLEAPNTQTQIGRLSVALDDKLFMLTASNE